MDVEFPALPPDFEFGASYYAGIGIFVLVVIIGAILMGVGAKVGDRAEKKVSQTTEEEPGQSEERSSSSEVGEGKKPSRKKGSGDLLGVAGLLVIGGAVAFVIIGGFGNLIWHQAATHNAKVEASRLLIDAAEERYGIIIAPRDASVMLTGPGEPCRSSRYNRNYNCSDRLDFTPAEGSVVHGDDATLQLADGTMLRVQLVWNEDQWILVRSGDPDLVELPS